VSGVRTHCAFCAADLELPAHQVLLTVHNRQQWRDTYGFQCPLCRRENSRPASDAIKAKLLSVTARVQRIEVPDEVTDPGRSAQNPLTWDDVLDFLDALETTEDLKALWRA